MSAIGSQTNTDDGRATAEPLGSGTHIFSGTSAGTSPAIRKRDLTPDQAWIAVIEHVRAVTGSSGAAIALRQHDAMVCKASIGDAPSKGTVLDDAHGICAECIRTGETVVIHEVEQDGRIHNTALRGSGIRSLVVIPLLSEGRVDGLVYACSRDRAAFDEAALERMRALTWTMEVVLFNPPENSLASSPAKPLQDARLESGVYPFSKALTEVIGPDDDFVPEFRHEQVEGEISLESLPAQVPEVIPTGRVEFDWSQIKSILKEPETDEEAPPVAPATKKSIPFRAVEPVEIPVGPVLSSASEALEQPQPVPIYGSQKPITSSETRKAPVAGSKAAAQAVSARARPPLWEKKRDDRRPLLPILAVALVVLIGAPVLVVSDRSAIRTPKVSKPEPATHEHRVESTELQVPRLNSGPKISDKDELPAAEPSFGQPERKTAGRTAFPAKPATSSDAEAANPTANAKPIASTPAASREVSESGTSDLSVQSDQTFVGLVAPAESAPVLSAYIDASSIMVSPKRDGKGQVTAVKMMSHRLPAYPLAARDANIQGSVVLQATVDAGGRVSQIEVLDGDLGLAAVAAGAVQSWIYEPARVDGRPVDATVLVTINFRLTP